MTEAETFAIVLTRLLERVAILAGAGSLLFCGLRILFREMSRLDAPTASVNVSVGTKGEGGGSAGKEAARAEGPPEGKGGVSVDVGASPYSLSLSGLTQGALIVLAGLVPLTASAFNTVKLNFQPVDQNAEKPHPATQGPAPSPPAVPTPSIIPVVIPIQWQPQYAPPPAMMPSGDGGPARWAVQTTPAQAPGPISGREMPTATEAPRGGAAGAQPQPNAPKPQPAATTATNSTAVSTNLNIKVQSQAEPPKSPLIASAEFSNNLNAFEGFNASLRDCGSALLGKDPPTADERREIRKLVHSHIRLFAASVSTDDPADTANALQLAQDASQKGRDTLWKLLQADAKLRAALYRDQAKNAPGDEGSRGKFKVYKEIEEYLERLVEVPYEKLAERDGGNETELLKQQKKADRLAAALAAHPATDAIASPAGDGPADRP